MKKITALALLFLMLAGCKAPAEETPMPTAEPQSALERLSHIQPEELLLEERLLLLPGPEPTAEELAPLLREAAQTPLDHGQADFIKNYVWQISFDISGEEPRRSWTLNAGTEENVVWLRVNEEEFWLNNAELYRLVRTSDDVYPDIDREAYAKYRQTVEAHYDRDIGSKWETGDCAVAGWELTMFRLAAEDRDLGLQVYEVKTATLTAPPEMAPVHVAGGSWVDSQLRILGDWRWSYLAVVDGEAAGLFYQEREIDLSQYAAKQEFLEMVQANLADAPEPVPDRGDLTEEEVDRVNEVFSTYDRKGDFVEYDPEVNGFFASHYADVRELNFEEFLRYFPDDGTLSKGDEREADALKALPIWEDGELERLMGNVPTHRFRRSTVDAVLKKYADITTRDLTDTNEPCYLPEYDCWYNFTSDFGPGSFTCEGGRVTEDTAVLWSGENDYCAGVRDELTLKKVGESWYIQSFLRVPVDREASLDAFLLGLQAEEIKETCDDWGSGKFPGREAVAELVRAAAQNRAEEWNYRDDDGEERTVWDMRLTLTDGRELTLGAGVQENIVQVVEDGTWETAYFRAPELYWLLRSEYDVADGNRGIDEAALEKYRTAVEGYLAQYSQDIPEIRMELTGLALVQESPALNAQVWRIDADMTTDPPELAPRMVGNGYVDSGLRMHGIGSDWYNLLVTVEGEALGFQGWNWLEAGGLDQYATPKELKEAMNGR